MNQTTRCLGHPLPTSFLVQFTFTVEQWKQRLPQRTLCDSGRNTLQLPSFCKQFNIVSISTASCNGPSVFAVLETKAVFAVVVVVNHSSYLGLDLGFPAQMVQFVLEDGYTSLS